MSSSNCCFLTCIHISQEAGKVVWYSHLLKNFPQFVVIHTVKDFGVVNKAKVDVFLELSCFFNDLVDVGNLIYCIYVYIYIYICEVSYIKMDMIIWNQKEKNKIPNSI